MARINIEFPSSFTFSSTIPVRITDLNYGGHVGNDSILSIIHEARAQFFKSFGYSEINLGGPGTIMSDVVINFNNELFYGDVVHVSVAVMNISRVAFDIVYLLMKQNVKVAEAKTGMVCFDYEKKKVMSVPEEVIKKFNSDSAHMTSGTA
ncbi:MAG TPA: thioesterase family protein [Flavitalea sp.]|nr:thioesterase family protein [Flavitalea sp.]